MAKKVASYFKNLKLKDLILPVIIILIAILLGVFKNQFVVATVNGKQISRIQLFAELEKRDGKTVLESLITEQLILQEAEKRKIQINQEEINQEVSKIEKSFSDQGQKLDDLLAAQNFSRNQLNRQIKIQQILKKIVGEAKVSDQEIDDYIEKNKDSVPQDAKMDEIKSQTKLQLEQQKLNDKIQQFVSTLQSKAKIEYLLAL